MKEIPDQYRVYHHWSYDPYIDEVYIDDEYDHELSGFVYRIDGGWRLTDKDHDVVDDPYIIRRVLDKLRGNDIYPSAPDDYDFTQIHYGEPLPIKES